jgi:hypothetical protein
MELSMKISTLALGVLVATGALAATADVASARVACNRFGDCWHVNDRYDYRPHWGIRVHEDNWRWRGRHYRWREHEGRGYWGRNGVWITF